MVICCYRTALQLQSFFFLREINFLTLIEYFSVKLVVVIPQQILLLSFLFFVKLILEVAVIRDTV